jgi:hypothetical protein
MTEHVACTCEKINAKMDFGGKPKGKGLLGKPRCRQENNIKMNLKRDAKVDMDMSNGCGINKI